VHVVERIEAHGERIAAGPGERWALASGDWVRLFDGVREAGELPDAPEHIHELRFDGDALLAAPCRASGGAWDPLPRLALEPWTVVTAAWAGERLLVAETAPEGGFEQHVRLYDGATREPGDVLWADSEWMRVEAVAAGGGRLAAGALEVRVWDDAGADLLTMAERGSQVRRILLGDEVIAGYADGHVAVHGRAAWDAHGDEARGLALAGDRLATGGWDGRVALWTLDGEPVDALELGAEIAAVAFLGADRLLALHDGGVSLIGT
jgi:hypothetical protein